ncbi:jupiter microtubule associated homolog 1-like isoform X1 [Acanthaster planci]|uniref:Microtubule-associated protein Jupiter n=1 Tax=Acanthaster planci TaxID=133434 RepID=A0A8B7Z1Z0_ACAPL|nr:jupiter microtubule associated homolog 1-like isoform X1 [Acanthaster planci]
MLAAFGERRRRVCKRRLLFQLIYNLREREVLLCTTNLTVESIFNKFLSKMTTTGTCVGIETIVKPTSRVLAPPGGKTNVSLGGYEEDTAPATRKQSTEVAEAEKQEAQKQAEKDLYKPSPPQPIRPAEDSFANIFGEDYLSKQPNNLPRGKRRFPDQTDLGHNPVTGEPNRTGPAEVEASPGGTRVRAKPQKIDPASMPAAGGRVESRAPMKRQPPGGKESGIF